MSSTSAKKNVQYLEEHFDNQTGLIDIKASEFAVQLITESIKTGLIFEPEKSFISPVNIDLTAVSGFSQEEIKFRFIYDQLLKSPSFKALFVNLFDDANKLNVQFKIEDIPQGGNGLIMGHCKLITSDSGSIYNEIVIDRGLLLLNSNVDITQVIVHECIHGFLNVKLRLPQIEISIENIDNMDLVQCIKTYYNSFLGSETQHDFLADHMTPVLVSILEEVKNDILTPQQINAVEHPEPNSVLYNVTQTIPSTIIYEEIIPWNWNDYFTHVSYLGLQKCSAYSIVYPKDSPNELNFRQYISIGITNFNN